MLKIMVSFSRLLMFVLCFFIFACKKEIVTIIEVPQPTPPDKQVAFYLDGNINSRYLLKTEDFKLLDSTGILLLPYITQSREFIISYRVPEGATVKMDTTYIVSGQSRVDFSKPANIRVIFSDGDIAIYSLSFHVFTGIPILWINTGDTVISRQEFGEGSLRLDVNGTGSVYSEAIPLEIRGRGNSTWGMPKKPYRIRFLQNTSILGLPATRNWVLLANFADKTMLRNDVAFEMGRQLSFDFVPRSKFVELFLNGEYMGTYQLTDQIRVETSRVNISQLTSEQTDPNVITGGYLLEVDERMDATTCFRTKHFNLAVCFSDPEIPNEAQMNYLVDYINGFEEALIGEESGSIPEKVAEFIDVNSFIDWYLVNELSRNNDALSFSSIYMFKDRDSLLKLGPIWDFDISLGNINYNGNYSPEGWWIRQGGWFAALFQHELFQQKLKQRWTYWKSNGLNKIFEHINARAGQLSFSQVQNFNKWQTLYAFTWPNYVVLGTYENEVQYLKDWLNSRIQWIDSQLQ